MNTEEQKDTHPTGGYEKRDVSVGKILVISMVGLVFIVLAIIVMMDYFVTTRESLINEMVLSPESATIRELRAREAEELGSYKLLDSASGRYRIPIDRAIELTSDEAYRARQTTGGK
jgi:hypothetical protein